MVDYAAVGGTYSRHRRTDPRIAALVWEALGDAETVINVGAGAGSYEPEDRYVVAVEPSAAMRAQRRTPAVDATAEALPFDDDSFDAAMAMVTIHQWSDVDRGLRELRRVARGPVVILTFDGEAVPRFWLNDYAPDVLALEASRYPPLDSLGGRVLEVPIPFDCVDGFAEAFYGRPEALLDPEVRRAQSAWGLAGVDDVPALREALASGEWDSRHGHLRTQPEFVGSLRLVVLSSHA
jgi:SAM-dependent methyltransferase